MKKSFTNFRRLMLLMLAFGTSLPAWAQTPVPVTLAGFNHDVIVSGNNSGTTNTAIVLSTNDVDGSGSGYNFMSYDYVNVAGAANPNSLATRLPNSGGTITSIATATPTLTFTLGNYSANNVLRVPATGSTGGGTGAGADAGTVSLSPSVAASTVYVLATGGGGAVTGIVVTITFADGTTQVATAQTVADWFAAGSNVVAYKGFGRVGRTTASAMDGASTTAPNLYQLTYPILAANQPKSIASITFGKTTTTGGVIDVFAVSVVPTAGVTACNSAPTPGTATATASYASPTSYTTLSLSGASTSPGLTYKWQYSTDNANWIDIPAYPSGSATVPASPYSQNPNAITCSVTNQAVATYYHCLVVCANDGLGGSLYISAPVLVNSLLAYCLPTSTATNEYLTNVTLGTINNSTTNQSSTAPVDFSTNPTATTTTTLNVGGAYPISVSARDNSSLSSAAVWIDYDHSGNFDASEFLLIGSGPTVNTPQYYTPQLLTVTTALAIPATALTGPTKMRVRWKNGQAASGEACTNYSGETEDYLITLNAAAACTGAAVTLGGAPSAICPNVAFSISALGATATSGVTYQWQSQLVGGTGFANISTTTYPSAATGTLVISQTAGTMYQVIATCSGSPTTSAPVTVALTAFDNCYCTPSAAVVPTPAPTVAGSPTSYLSSSGTTGCGTYGALTSVNFINSGTTAIALTPGCTTGSPYYANTAASAGSLTILTSYTLSGVLGKYSRAVVWIDYDHSGTFDASEYTFLGTNTSTSSTTTTYSVTLTIPTTALAGPTRMRFRTEANSGTLLTATTANKGNSCLTTTTYGQTQDYAVSLVAATACTTVPAITATSSAGATAVCTSTSVTLTASGMPAGMSGFAYQWQKSTSGSAGPFSAIPGATAATYAFTQSVTTDYNVVVTCAAGSSSATSNAVTVTQAGFISCYCVPTYTGSTTADGISQVVLGTLSYNTATVGNATPFYHDYTSYQTGATPTLQTPDLLPGNNASIAVTYGSDSNQWGAVWIDFNQNGIFGDVANEYVAATANGGANGTYTYTLPVPLTALAGLTRMRVRGGDDGSSPTLAQACGASGSPTYGEGEDYLVNILALTPCTGTPSAITAASSVMNACMNTPFTLSATGPAATTGGLSYQWQSSAPGANTFTNLGAAQNTPNYSVANQTTATDYQVVVTCLASALSSTSNTVAVGQNAPSACYCTPISGSCSYGGFFPFSIAGATTGAAPVFSTTTKAACTAAPNFNDYTSVVTNPTGTLSAGATYSISGAVNPNTRASMWIDYDRSGTFEASEFTQISYANTNVNNTFVASFTVPAAATAGATRMRIRTDYYSNATLGVSTNACATTAYGMTADYTVTLVGLPACTAGTVYTAVASSGFVSSVATSGRAVTLSVPGIAAGTTGLTYEWQSRLNTAGNTNAFASVSGATSATYSVSDQAASTDYQVIVTCGGTPTTSNPVTVANSIEGTFTTVLSQAGGEFITDFQMPNGISGTGFDNNMAAVRNTSGFTDFTGNPALTVTLNRGVLYTNTSMTAFVNSNSSQGGMWIDYNHNGTFEAAEYTFLGSFANAQGAQVTFPSAGATAGSVSGYSSPNPVSITVPAAAIVGPTRVRVRWRNGTIGASDAAVSGTTNWYGETEDYQINIQDAGLCTAAPNPVTAAASQPNACSNATVTLNATNIPTTLTGYTFQWQSRTGTAAFANVTVGTGGTTQSYTLTQTVPTDYQVTVTCQYGGLPITSNVVSVGQNAFDQCYTNCASTHAPGCDTGGGTITNVTLNTLNNTSGCASGAPFLTVFPAVGTATTSLYMGNTYSLSVSNNSNPTVGNGYYYGVWLDYNHNGTFDASEFVPNTYSTTSTSATTTTISVTIPAASATVLSGATRMRIVSDNAGSNFYGSFAAGDGCSTGRIGGETEDYTVTLLVPIDLVVSTTTTIPAGTYNNVTVTPTGNGTLTGATVVNGTFGVATGGTLNTACQPLTGPGTFIMAAGATLDICNPQGITLSGATGAIQMTSRQFSVAGTYIYSGSAAQVTGSALPALVRNLTVNTSGGASLTLSQAVAIRRLLALNSGNVLNGQNLTLRSDADSTALVSIGTNGGTVSGAATVQRYISAATNAGLGYRHFASPVTNTTVADLATGSFSPSVSQGAAYNASATPGIVSPFPNVFGYTEARQATSPATGYTVFDRGWFAPSATTDALQPGKGYTVNLAAGQMVDFVGTLGTGSVPLALTRGATTDAGWNLVGNPYPSTLNWDNVTIPTGLDAAVYVYQSASQYAGSYGSYTNGLGTGNSRTATIGMGQGFFVRVSPGSSAATLTLTDAARSTDFSSDGAFQRGNDPRPRVRLALENAGAVLTDAAYVYFEAGATAGIDTRYDAVKLANPTGLSLSAVAAGTNLAINGLPVLSTTTLVPLTVAVPQAGTYTLRTDELLNLTGAPVYLLDALTGRQVDLVQQPSYSFTSTGAAQITGRFSLNFAPAGPLATQSNLSAASVSIYPNPAHTSFTVLVPAVPGAKQVQLTLFNSLGQRVREQAVLLGTTGAQAAMDVKDLASGIYTLRLQVAGQAAVARRVAVD